MTVFVELSWSDSDALRMMLRRAVNEPDQYASRADVEAARALLARLDAAIAKQEGQA